MEPNFQASFIPKKPIVSGQVESRPFIGPYFIIAILVFIFSALTGGYVYYQENATIKNIEIAKQTLEKARDAFDPTLLKSLSRTDIRINTSRDLLLAHPIASPVFGVISSSTLKSVRFKSFDLAFAKDKITLSMKGTAENFTAIALQSREFAKNRYIKSPILSDMALDLNGNVNFSFTSALDSELLSYKNSVK